VNFSLSQIVPKVLKWILKFPTSQSKAPTRLASIM
jgi:hypothetical protein